MSKSKINIPILRSPVAIYKVYIDGSCGSKTDTGNFQGPIVLHTLISGNSRAQFSLYIHKVEAKYSTNLGYTFINRPPYRAHLYILYLCILIT